MCTYFKLFLRIYNINFSIGFYIFSTHLRNFAFSRLPPKPQIQSHCSIRCKQEAQSKLLENPNNNRNVWFKKHWQCVTILKAIVGSRFLLARKIVFIFKYQVFFAYSMRCTCKPRVYYLRRRVLFPPNTSLVNTSTKKSILTRSATQDCFPMCIRTAHSFLHHSRSALI